MSKPVLFFVPGYWEGSAAFQPVATSLRDYGYETCIAPRPSTDLAASENPKPSMENDIAAIRSSLLSLVESGKEVIILPHSAGGFLGGEAMEGLDIKTRRKDSLSGGVTSFVFLTAASVAVGTVHESLPFAYLDEADNLCCKNPEQVLFNDFSEEQLKEWLPKMNSQPKGSYCGTTKYAGWTVLPSHYVVFEKDACIPVAFQLQLAGVAGSEIHRGFQAGHMGQISETEELAKIIDRIVSGL